MVLSIDVLILSFRSLKGYLDNRKTYEAFEAVRDSNDTIQYSGDDLILMDYHTNGTLLSSQTLTRGILSVRKTHSIYQEKN